MLSRKNNNPFFTQLYNNNTFAILNIDKPIRFATFIDKHLSYHLDINKLDHTTYIYQSILSSPNGFYNLVYFPIRNSLSTKKNLLNNKSLGNKSNYQTLTKKTNNFLTPCWDYHTLYLLKNSPL